MNLEHRLTEVLQDIHATTQKSSAMSCNDLIPLIDLTLLDPKATPPEINALVTKANLHRVAAICILPEHLDYIEVDTRIKRATVANFPTGMQPQQQILKKILRATRLRQVDEVDYVFPYQDYLSGRQTEALTNCLEVYQLCKQHKLSFKVILETGALPSHNAIYDLSTAIINNGCDFLKTSTGKIATGATIPATLSMLAAIADTKASCGIKVSGGIRTTEQAYTYMQMAQYMFNCKLNSSRFRIGASSLLDDLLRQP